jgi:hypothetical protein
MSRAVRLAGVGLLALGGCLPLDLFREDSDFAQVPTSPFPAPPQHVAKRPKTNFTPASQDIAWRVDSVGRKLLAANPQAGLNPLFATIGSPDPEVFHADLTIVYVTEGLVRQCRGEADLAAVLATELGRMVSEREAIARREVRTFEPTPPIPLPIGGQGNPLAADPTYYVELAKFEKEHPKSDRTRPLPPPDPRKVAVAILEQAGFQKADLDAAAPILRSAEQHCTLEHQFKGIVDSDAGINWRPH